jgi:hypothetical protein
MIKKKVIYETNNTASSSTFPVAMQMVLMACVSGNHHNNLIEMKTPLFGSNKFETTGEMYYRSETTNIVTMQASLSTTDFEIHEVNFNGMVFRTKNKDRHKYVDLNKK